MTDVDLDRLADYVGGALDGTPDAAVVADLVATDPGWARAYSDLVSAEAAVRQDLASLVAEPESMPADVVTRLSAALAALPEAPPPADSPRLGSTGRRAHPMRPPAGPVRPARPVSRERRRRRRLVLAFSAAAVAVVCGLGAVNVLPQLLRPGGQTASTSRGANADALSGSATASGPAGAAAAPPGVRLLASGTNYGPDTVGAVVAKTLSPGARAADSGVAPQSVPEANIAAVPDALRRLTDPVARTACLDAVVRAYGGQVTLVDYARYQGTPALVVLVSDAFGSAGRQWVVVVGARCGEGGAISDLLYSASTH